MSEENFAPENDVVELGESNDVNDSNSNEDSSESSDELNDQVEQAIENGASKKEVQNMIRKYELKVNGKNVTREIDLNDEESIKRELQKAYAFQQTASESAEMKKLFSDYISKLKNDPYAALEELGLDPDEIAERRLEQRIEQLKKSPEQIAYEKMQKELEEARGKLKKQEEEAEAMQMQKLQQEIETNLNQDITRALDAHKELPATEYTIKKIADTLIWAMDRGHEDVTVEDIMPIVKKEIKGDIQKFINSVPEEFLDEYLSNQLLEKQRKRKMSQIKQVNNINNLKKPTMEATKKEEAPKKRVSIDDWMRR